MSNFIDYKATIWHRIKLSDNSKTEEVIKLLDKSHDVNVLYNEDIVESSSQILYETEEIITVDENGGCATIEVYTADGEKLWDNSEVE